MRELFNLTPIGPNRHSDKTLVEQMFGMDESELAAIADAAEPIRAGVLAQLRAFRLMVPRDALPQSSMPGKVAERLAWLYGGAAVLLQRAAGHEVAMFAALPRESAAQAHVIFEYEQAEVGEWAGELALCLLSGLCPDLDWQPRVLDRSRPFDELFHDFWRFSSKRVLPVATRAIFDAAARLDVPCVKLERDPYQGVGGSRRIRPNSMLMLGHCRHRHIVDGTLCIDKSYGLLPIVNQYDALMNRTSSLFPRAREPVDPSAKTFTLVVANLQVVGTVPPARPNPGICARAVNASRLLGAGLLAVTVRTPDISQPLEAVGGVVIRVDPAPLLDDLLPPGSPVLEAAAEGFLRWLFPKGSQSRIPVVAVTGTNGKTTTSRMISRIMRADGKNTALRCSDGSYFNDRFIDLGDAPAVDRFFMQFENPEVEVAVQETHFGRILRQGFPYLWSNVAVCTNVTTDHVGRLGVDTVEQMAGVKRAVLERARDGAVLNAEDEHCRAMVPRLQAKKLCLVSSRSDAAGLRARFGEGHCLLVLEAVDGREWIVMHDDGRRPVAAVDQVPAAFGGAARCNIENAMQAIAAGHVLGVSLETMRNALSAFTMDMNNAIGRFNIYRGHPFAVVMDFAHNADGIRRIGEFLDAQDVRGRRIMLMAASGERSDVDIREKGRAAAECFDHFVVRSYPDRRGRGRREIVEYMSGFLAEAGVPAEAITGVPDPDEGTRAILEMAREGDWLVMNWGNGEAERMWDAITSFQPGQV